MKKSEFIKNMTINLDNAHKEKVKIAIDEIFNTISNAMINGDRVELRGFGTFATKEVLPRKARNPKTGKPVNVELKYKMAFKSSKELKEYINK